MTNLNEQLENKILQELGTSPPHFTENRFCRWGGHSKKYWLKYQFIEIDSGSILNYAFGDWSSGTVYRGRLPELAELSKEEVKLLKRKQKELEASLIKEQALEHERVAQSALEKWNAYSSEFTSHPYMEKKLIRNKYGARVAAHNDMLVPINLYIPLMDEDGKLWNLQSISESGLKMFMSGGRKKGLFHCLQGEFKTASVILLGEGWATCAAIAQSLNNESHAVLCAFDCGNLIHVAATIRKHNQNATLVICADLDESGIGELKAREAAQKHRGTTIVPSFKTEKELTTNGN